ncbi:MAG TPA: M55 family metallopeptidase [Candidatus Latescibacteria bacterium]|nr:M55 family metallopeptidase [Candidatus Latescibacterota bacterium]HOS63657.1 M55 family metallopeptidase [Candidatus Latescibacterota bacterium]HPK73408.1 M55 family metallopeptidase [Candidatus Latescibacterota bacterium]
MKIYLCTDMEGASGVTMRSEIEPGQERYEFGRRMLTRDVAAAVEGLRAGGATRVVVLDGHGGGDNFLYDELPAGAEYICGRGGDPIPFLDDSFDAVGFVGQHSMAGTPDAVWPHTQSWTDVLGLWANGREIGEIGQFAIFAGHYNLPVVFLSGDRAACAEVRALCGEVQTVAVKQGCSPTRALCLSRAEADKAIYEAARESARGAIRTAPCRVEVPMEIRVRFTKTSLADGCVQTGAERVDEVTVRRVVPSALDIYRM